jgi:photosystem II protein
VACAAKKQEGMGSAGNPWLPGFGKQDDKLNQSSLDPKKRLATQDVDSGPLNKAGYQDPSGSKGKGKGVYQFSGKYGGNIDVYAPIYNPQTFGDDFVTGMTEQQFVIFMAVLAPVFLSLPLLIALKGYGII